MCPLGEGGLFWGGGGGVGVVGLSCKGAKFCKDPVLLWGAGPGVGEDSGVSFGFLPWEADCEGGGGEGRVFRHEQDGNDCGKLRSFGEIFLLPQGEKALARMFVVDE